MISSEKTVNNGRPSVQGSDGKWYTVRMVVNFIESGVEILEVMEECKLTKVQVLTCLEYKKMYPEVMN